MSADVAKWRVAHPEIEIEDIALETMAPFPSLFANDFTVYVEGKGRHGDEVVSFVRDLGRELVWAYGMVVNAQRNNDAVKLMTALLDGASGGPEYEFVGRYLRDFAKANNIKLPTDHVEPAWRYIEAA